MDLETLVMLKKDVKFDIHNNKSRIYQSIRSLSEYIIKKTLMKLNPQVFHENMKIDMYDLIEYLRTYGINFDLDNFQNNIIRKRNIREHQPESFNEEIDHKDVKEIILCYNDLVKALGKMSKQTMKEAYFNEDIFYTGFSVRAASPAESVEKTSKEMEAGFDEKRLQRKLIKLKKELKTSEDQNQYKLRSEIITVKNHIKMNDNKLIDIYSTEKRPCRKPLVNILSSEYFLIGLSEKDYGFRIKGILNKDKCRSSNSSIFAIIFNLLQKNLIYKPSKYLLDYERRYKVKLNYSNIIRYQFLYLTLIRRNYLKDYIKLKIIDGNIYEFRAAVEDILNYANIFASLSKKKIQIPRIEISENGLPVAIYDSAEAKICCETLLERKSFKPSYWYESSLIYSLDDSNKDCLTTLLKDFFGYESFKNGQIESIVNMLNNQSSILCVMPTSAGKSLIYYFVSFLTPSPVLIVSPTKMLIIDQIRNLKTIHGITNCSILEEQYDYSEYWFNEKLNYILPETFTNYSFTDRLTQFFNLGLINNIVLDEIHCASNWSHDYRPAYLMLSQYIIKYIPSIRILGFTATTSTLITKDIIRQFSINAENVIEPIKLRREDISIEFFAYKNGHDLVKDLQIMLTEKKTKSLLFTKSSDISKNIFNRFSQDMQIQCDIFANENIDTYQDFVDGNTGILLTSSDMGIGINIPGIESSYHLGYPYSRNQFIQEVGRISRDGSTGEATVLVIDFNNLQEIERKVLDFSSSIESLVEIVSSFSSTKSDIIQTFKIIIGHIEAPDVCITKIKEVYTALANKKSKVRLFNYNYSNTDEQKKLNKIHMQMYLMVLKNMGIIEEWFIEGDVVKGTFYYVDVGINSENTANIKNNTIKYLRSMNAVEDTILKVKQCGSIMEIISTYMDWYYYTYIYFHREQFINMILMVSQSINQIEGENEFVSDFSLSLASTERIRRYVSNQTIDTLIKNKEFLLKKSTRFLVEKSIEENYDVLFDVILLAIDAINNNHFFVTRFKRVMKNLTEHKLLQFRKSILILFNYTQDKNRIVLLDYICSNWKPVQVLKTAYEEQSLDYAYYVIICKLINKKLKGVD